MSLAVFAVKQALTFLVESDPSSVSVKGGNINPQKQEFGLLFSLSGLKLVFSLGLKQYIPFLAQSCILTPDVFLRK